MKTWMKLALQSLMTFVIVYILFCSIIYFNQRSFLYHPPADNFAACPFFDSSQIHEQSGTRYYGNVNQTRNLTVIVYFHGNAESACENELWKAQATTHNMSFLIPEYPGYSSDKQVTTKEQILADTEKIAHILQGRKVIVIGRSIGNGPAAYLANLTNASRLIMISPYDRLSSVVWDKFIPGFLLKDNFEPINYLQTYEGKVIIFAGTADTTIPLIISKRLNATEFITVLNATHNSILDDDYREIIQKIVQN